MFDLGFWEIIMIMIVALVVVGPERLPGLARTAGLWVGKAKRFVANVKTEIDQELASEELKKVLSRQNIMDDVYEIIEETKQVTNEIKQEVTRKVELDNAQIETTNTISEEKVATPQEQPVAKITSDKASS